MIKTLLVAALVTSAGQASALSCLFGDTAVAYNQAAGYGDDFLSVTGSLDWDLPEADPNSFNLAMDYEGQTYEVAAHFTGEVIGENGSSIPIDVDVTILTECINGDCGYAHKGQPMLSFLHPQGADYVMHAFPCQSYPSGFDAEALAILQSCVDGGECDDTLVWE